MDRLFMINEFARRNVQAGSPFTTDQALQDLYSAWIEMGRPEDCWIGFDFDANHNRVINVKRQEHGCEGLDNALRETP